MEKNGNSALYAAVKGAQFDGNDYITVAIEKGAGSVITDKRSIAENCSVPAILVEDNIKAHLALIKWRREKCPQKLCGITGSVGKTSTKDMIYAVLSSEFNTVKTIENNNLYSGLLSLLLGVTDDCQAIVVEMGQTSLGRISDYSLATNPDCVVVTNIGYSHLEFMKTRENIFKNKLSIVDGAKPDAPLILCGDDEYLDTVDIKDRKIVRYGFSEHCEVKAANIVHLDGEESFTLIDGENCYAAKIPVNGEHHILNALAAYCVGKCYGMTSEKIIASFMNYESSSLRQKIFDFDGIRYIVDCYNASPTSMKSALTILKESNCDGRKIAVLGDMLELGDNSEKLHRMVAEYIIQNSDVAFLFGKEMSACENELIKNNFEVYHSQDREELTEKIKNYIKEGDVLFFKGSRGVKMEYIFNALTGMNLKNK